MDRNARLDNWYPSRQPLFTFELFWRAKDIWLGLFRSTDCVHQLLEKLIAGVYIIKLFTTTPIAIENKVKTKSLSFVFTTILQLLTSYVERKF